MNIIETEQEAIVAVLYSIVMMDNVATDHESEKLSDIVGSCLKFKGADFKNIYAKAAYASSTKNINEIIDEAAPFITDGFIKTFFAISCDLLCSDGNTSKSDIGLLAYLAIKLQIPEEEYLPIASAFMSRYAWNFNIE